MTSAGVDARLDPRVVRTRRALRAALVELAEEVPLTAVSVSMVTSRAALSRPTFYDHYVDLDELTVDALRHEFEELRDHARATGELVADGEGAHVPPPGLVRLVCFLHERRGLLARALGPGGSTGFVTWLHASMVSDVIEGVRLRPELRVDDVPEDVEADFVVGALLGTLLPRLVGDAVPEPLALAEQTWTLLRRLFDGPVEAG